MTFEPSSPDGIKPPTKESNQRLLDAMDAVGRKDSPERRAELYRSFLESILVLPVNQIPAGFASGATTLPGNTNLQITLFVNPNGIRLAPVFTDVEVLAAWDPNRPFIAAPAIQIFSMIAGTDADEIVVNPFNPGRQMMRPAGRILRREFEALAQGHTPLPAIPPLRKPDDPTVTPIRLRAGQSIAVGAPERLPGDAVLVSLRSAAAEAPAISALYVFQYAMGDRPNEWSAPAIGIEASSVAPPEEKQKIVAHLGARVREHLSSAHPLDFIFLEAALLLPVQQNGLSIYRRDSKH